MTYLTNHTSLKEILDNPLNFPITSIIIKPFLDKNSAYIQMSVEYKAGHIINYRYGENIDLFDKLLQLLMQETV